MRPDQRVKLPVYAQQHIGALERRIENLETDLAAMVEATPVTNITSGHAFPDRPTHYLPDDREINFHRAGGRCTLSVSWDPDTRELSLRGDGQLLIQPHVTNRITVKVAAR